MLAESRMTSAFYEPHGPSVKSGHLLKAAIPKAHWAFESIALRRIGSVQELKEGSMVENSSSRNMTGPETREETARVEAEYPEGLHISSFKLRQKSAAMRSRGGCFGARGKNPEGILKARKKCLQP